MLSIPCPVCGARDEDEFVFGGDASVVRPADPMSVDDATWTVFLYRRDKPAGAVWAHRLTASTLTPTTSATRTPMC